METDHERFERLNNQLWQRSRVDEHGRLTLPIQLRKKLGINGRKGIILWIQINRKEKDNLHLIEVGVKK